MCVTVSSGGTVTFRYDYRLNGRRETLTLGRYGPGGISLVMARELLLDARKAVLKSTSPAVERPPHGGAANRSRAASARRAGRAGAWHGADRPAGILTARDEDASRLRTIL
jgi:hypothetical protein